MTPEELDEARAKEAQRLWESGQEAGSSSWVVAARLAREGWTPPEPVVDPDILAFREWLVKQWPDLQEDATSGKTDNIVPARAFLAGARMATERERERARPLVECCGNLQQFSGWADGKRAAQALAKYRGEA